MSITTITAAEETLNLLKKRWSPRAFADKPVENEKLSRIFEAARWAASAYNEQPWRFIVAAKGDENYKKVFDGFHEFNQVWLKSAPVIFFIIAKKTFSHDGNPNGWSVYDAGQAAANLSIQATAEGLHVHQMAGILKDKIVEIFNIPDDFVPVTGFGLGYLGSPDILPEPLKQRELAERVRKPIGEIVFSEWGKSSDKV